MFILIRLTQHVLGIIMPIVRRTDYVNNCMWSMPGCVGCSLAELEHELCAHSSCPKSARLQPTQAGIHHMKLFTKSVLLTMGIMMPETC